jgi:hypothetical protein
MFLFRISTAAVLGINKRVAKAVRSDQRALYSSRQKSMVPLIKVLEEEMSA